MLSKRVRTPLVIQRLYKFSKFNTIISAFWPTDDDNFGSVVYVRAGIIAADYSDCSQQFCEYPSSGSKLR